MMTEASFRYTSEDCEGSPIPKRSVDGTITADFTDPDSVKVEIHGPLPASAGVISLTLEQLRSLVIQAIQIEAIAEKNRKATS